ncbi:hypothetical protein LTR62_002895 [Meristemomyces frigidus]|uniref:RING-type domain-containing protein n=1 Tax=Meristemomyces frigidus TaxID=1508187 RepID=A0AAN7YKT3_9PEZI|nr:hypothetical protein LTR62_002895 [Meristemomyces frigidus]
MSHSKRNTSLAFFTAHERNEVANHWGSRTTRLTRDSFLPFASCQLCLLPAREPVTCASHGHLFCRECALSNILAQGKELKRLRKEAERRQAEDAEEQGVVDEEGRVKAVEEFERVQAGLSARGGAGQRIVGRKNGKVVVEQEGASGTKRKLELDEDELVQLGKHVDPKRARSSEGKSELPSFWVPSETPTNKKADLKPIKLQPTCPAAEMDKPHDFTLKTLVTVNFSSSKPDSTTTEDDSFKPEIRSCPSCDKALSNSTKAVLAKPCGHVLCKPCSDKFQRPPDKSAHDAEVEKVVRCYICQEDITAGRQQKVEGRESHSKSGKGEKGVERGLVELSSDGTGFAGGGKNMVKKSGIAFQC